jgi:hypothetical protein
MSQTSVQPDPTSSNALLSQADEIHDDEPERARDLLRRVVPAELPAARLPRLAFLLNHVLGEKLELWPEALLRHQAIVDAARADMPQTVLRQAAIAAQIAGDGLHAHEWTQALAASASAPLPKARALVALGVVAFSASRQDAETAGRRTLQALQPLAAIHATSGTGLDGAFGVVTNNLASDLLDRPPIELDQPDLRTALELTAEHAQRFWQRAGQWVDFERAHYLRALAANALGQGAQAAQHARSGLDVLDAHDGDHAEDVDRAFLELELAQGLLLSGQAGNAAAQARAESLAARFGDASLEKWFARRLQRNAALAAYYGRG